MNTILINTILNKDEDFCLYKIGEISIVERIIKSLKKIKATKVYLLLDEYQYYKYKHIIEKYEISYVYNSDNIFSTEENLFKIDGNIFFDNNISYLFTDKDKLAFNNHNIIKINNIDIYLKTKQKYNYEICMRHINEGVDIYDANSVFIGEDVVIEKDVTIYPNNYICGKTIISKGSIIYPNNVIVDSYIGQKCQIGPFCNLKKDTHIGDSCIVGTFVEVKNSKIKNNVKAKHHAYLGDLDIGNDCNIGCGFVSANYNGKKKYRSIIEDRVFVGSNVTLVSPVEVGKGSLIAAGSTIVNDIESNTLAIARTRQINKVNYYK